MPFGPCVEAAPQGVVCASVDVPVHHADPAGPKRAIAVRKWAASGGSARGQLWYVDGGPGDSGTADLPNLAGIRALVPDFDIVAFDVRGVGDSGRLGCPTEEAATSRDGREIVGKEWSTCVEQVRALPDLDGYTTAETAGDLEAAVAELRAGTVVLWGVSYGTFLVDRALVDQPGLADAVVLDGLVPPTWDFSRFDAGMDAQVRRWLGDACAADADCRARLGPDPVGFATRVLDSLGAGHCKKLKLDASTARALAGTMFQRGGDLATQVPAVFWRLDRCEGRDLRAFVHLFGVLFPRGGGGIGEKPSHSAVLQRQIAYTDLWQADADPAALQARVDAAVGSTGVSARFAQVAAGWPVGPRDPAAGRYGSPEMPVLLMHGGYDAVVPLEVAHGYADAWPRATWVPVPYAGHVAYNAGACPRSIVAAFVEHPDAPVDTACVAAMPPPSFAAKAEVDQPLWGAPDRWGDR